jgi:hypothetical protein
VASISHLYGRLAAIRAKTDEIVVLLDGVEQPKQCPHDPEQQYADYSGKKKGHRRKNIVVSTYHRRRVDDLSKTVEGRRYDKPIEDEAELIMSINNTITSQNTLIFQYTYYFIVVGKIHCPYLVVNNYLTILRSMNPNHHIFYPGERH